MTEAERFDVAVIGAGPAGAAAALAAARAGATVLCCDPREPTFDAPCGEGLMADGVAALRALRLTDALEAALPFDAATFVAPGGRRVAAPAPGAAALSRPALQSALAAALDGEPRVRRLRVRARVRRAGRGFDVAGAGWSARAGAAVFASGLPSIDDAAAPRSSRRAALRPAVRARFAAGARPLDGVEVHLGRGCEVYLTPLPGGLVNAAALWDVGAVRRGAERDPEDGVAARAAERLLADALDRHPAARDALGPPATPALARAVGERAGRRRVDVGLFHAGDAALAVDPIVGCGVSLALSSGLAAGVAAAAHARGDAAPDASVEHARSVRSAAAGRLRLARFLRYLSTHPAVADAALAVFARTPAVVRALARVGAAARPDAFRR